MHSIVEAVHSQCLRGVRHRNPPTERPRQASRTEGDTRCPGQGVDDRPDSRAMHGDAKPPDESALLTPGPSTIVPPYPVRSRDRFEPRDDRYVDRDPLRDVQQRLPADLRRRLHGLRAGHPDRDAGGGLGGSDRSARQVPPDPQGGDPPAGRPRGRLRSGPGRPCRRSAAATADWMSLADWWSSQWPSSWPR